MNSCMFLLNRHKKQAVVSSEVVEPKWYELFPTLGAWKAMGVESDAVARVNLAVPGNDALPHADNENNAPVWSTERGWYNDTNSKFRALYCNNIVVASGWPHTIAAKLKADTISSTYRMAIGAAKTSSHQFDIGITSADVGNYIVGTKIISTTGVSTGDEHILIMAFTAPRTIKTMVDGTYAELTLLTDPVFASDINYYCYNTGYNTSTFTKEEIHAFIIIDKSLDESEMTTLHTALLAV